MFDVGTSGTRGRFRSTRWRPAFAVRWWGGCVRASTQRGLLLCLVSALPWLIACVPAVSTEQAPSGPAAPNESLVTASVTDVEIVDSATLGMQPPQPLSVLTLRLLSVSATGDLPPAVRAAGETVRAYSKDTELTRLKGTTVTAVLTLRGDERGGRLWLVRLESPGGPK
jgi:hypothetical protein